MPNVSNCGVQISSENPDKCQANNGFYVDKYHNYFKYYSKQEIHCYGADKNIAILFGLFYLVIMWNALAVKSLELGELGISFKWKLTIEKLVQLFPPSEKSSLFDNNCCGFIINSNI